MLDQGSWNVRLDKQEFIDLGILSQDMGSNTLARTPATGVALRSLERSNGQFSVKRKYLIALEDGRQSGHAEMVIQSIFIIHVSIFVN